LKFISVKSDSTCILIAILGESLMHARTEKLRHLYGWDSSYATMTPATPENYKYPDGIVLTLKSCARADHFFVERTFAVQLANSIRESLTAKKGKTQPKKADSKTKLPKKTNKAKPKPD